MADTKEAAQCFARIATQLVGAAFFLGDLLLAAIGRIKTAVALHQLGQRTAINDSTVEVQQLAFAFDLLGRHVGQSGKTQGLLGSPVACKLPVCLDHGVDSRDL
ncbi:hypothetical protein D9M71_810220 [compost metagenome]